MRGGKDSHEEGGQEEEKLKVESRWYGTRGGTGGQEGAEEASTMILTTRY